MKSICALSDKITAVLDNNDVSVCCMDEQEGEVWAELEWYSPAGEDFCFAVWFDGTDAGFVEGFKSYSADFNPDEHAEMWVDGRGKNGVPGSIRELIDDAEAISDHLQAVSSALNDLEFDDEEEEE